MTQQFLKKYKPNAFVPTSSLAGDEAPLIIRGENMWVRFGRFGQIFGEGYSGTRDLSEFIDTKNIGTLTWTAGDKSVTGTGFFNEIRIGQFILGNGGAGATQLFVVEEVKSDTEFYATRVPGETGSGTGYVLPVLFPVGTSRGTAISGNVIRFAKGHYLGVGDGEFKINGQSLNLPFNLSKTPQVALHDPSTDTYIIDDIGIDIPTASPLISLAAVASADSKMLAGQYNIRVVASSSKTTGYSNPSPVIAPVTITDGQAIEITFNDNMAADQDQWDIYSSVFQDNLDPAIRPEYMGPWYKVETVSDVDLGSRLSGTTHTFYFADAEIVIKGGLLSYDNFVGVDAEYVDLINGIPIYFSCQGKGNPSKLNGTSPGPAAIPSKPSNPEAVFLTKTLTTAEGDYIIGEFNVKSRIFVLCQNSMQTVLLTTVDEEPIAFRSQWTAGFRNPYSAAFLKEYLYAFSTQGIIRTVAGGDDSSIEFEFASDLNDYIIDWDPGHVLVGYCPKNKAMCFFYAAAERRSTKWVTIVVPLLRDKDVWNPPIVLADPAGDFIVSGVATIGNDLTFVAGGRQNDGSILVNTYIFDGGDSSSKDWYLAWNYSDDNFEHYTKRLSGLSATGRFASVTETKLQLHGVDADGAFEFTNLEAGSSPTNEVVLGSTATKIKRIKYTKTDMDPCSVYSIRIQGRYTSVVDRLDEINVEVDVNSSKI